jgi:surfactin synthase thioesterase subunit
MESRHRDMGANETTGNDWMNGGVSQYPDHATNVSSFAALDTMVAFFANKTAFPKMKAITLAGHSAGGQVSSSV